MLIHFDSIRSESVEHFYSEYDEYESESSGNQPKAKTGLGKKGQFGTPRQDFGLRKQIELESPRAHGLEDYLPIPWSVERSLRHDMLHELGESMLRESVLDTYTVFDQK